VIDDDPDVRRLLTEALSRDGHSVTACGDVESGRESLRDRPADVIVLDIGLPDGSGIALSRELRRNGEEVGILLLTARAQVATRVEGLDAGADDFLAKPFAVAELRARVRALGRRAAHRPLAMCVQGDGFEVDLGARRAFVQGREVPLTAREWAIVELLIARRGARVLKSDILESVWGETSEEAAASLEVIVARVRRKLGPSSIRTIRGEGYAFGS